MINQELIVLPEPELEFRYSQNMISPHDGLTIFGPYDADTPGHPKNISYGIVSTSQGCELFVNFVHMMQMPISCSNYDSQRKLWPYYPGFEAVFTSKLSLDATRRYGIDPVELYELSQDRDGHKRAGSIVEKYLLGIQNILMRDDPIDLIYCIVPDIVYKNCRPMSIVSEGMGHRISSKERKTRAAGVLDLFGSYKVDHYKYSVDFRRQIKARTMQHNVPIQIIRESTLLTSDDGNDQRQLTPLSDRAWNLSVCSYYKSGGKPWRLTTARDGVCYIGIAYKKTEERLTSKSACCAAQMFLDSGDGIVFMGERGAWYSPEKREFHLSRDAAFRMLKGILDSYEKLEGKPLKEIFIHSYSSVDEEEYDGFSKACPDNVKLVCIRVRPENRNGIRLFREGNMPVLRGSYLELSGTSCLLWTTGFKHRLGTYDGWEVPIPLRIDIQHGIHDIKQVALDIFGLTKLNYNACRIGEREPVTVGFSKEVGEILVSNPTIKNPSQKFKFYI